MEIVHKAMRGETADALARLDGCGAESDLIALAGDCLATGREDRPRHAGLVAERITAHLAGIQERLRAAELERARAEARASEERKRRQLTGTLAATVLTLLVMSGAGAAWYARRVQLQSATETMLLREGELLLNIARGNDRDNPDNWRMA
jgi:eukaryotic-like serine/threonine-protein kinase